MNEPTIKDFENRGKRYQVRSHRVDTKVVISIYRWEENWKTREMEWYLTYGATPKFLKEYVDAERLRLQAEVAEIKAEAVKGKKPNAGHCAICMGVFKVDSVNGMVNHGYQRPGVGYLIGKCFGVGYLPYELGCQALHGWVIEVGKLRKAAEARREAMRRDGYSETLYLHFRANSWDRQKTLYAFQANGTVTPELPRPYRHLTYAEVLRRKLSELDSEIRWLAEELDRANSMIAAWPTRKRTTLIYKA